VKRHYLWLICLLLFVLQSTIMYWLLPPSWQSVVHISPNFVFVVILFIALYKGRHHALAYGLVFGLLQDFIFYGHMIGPNSFAMGLTGYLVGLLQDRRQHFVLSTVTLVGLAYMAFESMLYGSYRLFDVTHVDFVYAVTRYMLPSALFNMLAALIFYIPMRKLLDHLSTPKKEREPE